MGISPADGRARDENAVGKRSNVLPAQPPGHSSTIYLIVSAIDPLYIDLETHFRSKSDRRGMES